MKTLQKDQFEFFVDSFLLTLFLFVIFKNDGKPLAKGPITKGIVKHIQEDLKSCMEGGPKHLFSWATMQCN